MTRDSDIDRFLENADWQGAVRAPLAGDASFRRYERVRHADGRQAVLMDAPPDKEDVRPFVQVAEYLLSAGFTPPEIWAKDEVRGLLLLEDLGDALYNPVLAEQKDAEMPLYTAAVDALLEVAGQSRYPDVPAYDDALLLRELRLFSEWYLPAVLEAPLPEEALREWEALWQEQLFPLARQVPDTLILRDYHADNLLWLPEREGVRRVGLLDFQDAVIGPVTYDLVSLLEDARRDVSPALAEAMQRHMQAQLPGVDAEAFAASYAIMGAQRNLKIIGIFMRLAVRDGKTHYPQLLPRVWGYLAQDMQHPALKPCCAWLDAHVPQDKRGVPA